MNYSVLFAKYDFFDMWLSIILCEQVSSKSLRTIKGHNLWGGKRSKEISTIGFWYCNTVQDHHNVSEKSTVTSDSTIWGNLHILKQYKWGLWVANLISDREYPPNLCCGLLIVFRGVKPRFTWKILYILPPFSNVSEIAMTSTSSLLAAYRVILRSYLQVCSLFYQACTRIPTKSTLLHYLILAFDSYPIFLQEPFGGEGITSKRTQPCPSEKQRCYFKNSVEESSIPTFPYSKGKKKWEIDLHHQFYHHRSKIHRLSQTHLVRVSSMTSYPQPQEKRLSTSKNAWLSHYNPSRSQKVSLIYSTA